MPRMAKWNYSGDVNLEYGGLFWREDGSDDYVLAVEVTPCADAGGPGNVFYVETGSIYLPPETDKRKAALGCIGAEVDTASRAELVEACRAYHGIDRDAVNGKLFIRVGKPEKGARGFGADPARHDRVLRANQSLRRYVEREFLD